MKRFINYAWSAICVLSFLMIAIVLPVGCLVFKIYQGDVVGAVAWAFICSYMIKSLAFRG
jgi:hypothetical protein